MEGPQDREERDDGLSGEPGTPGGRDAADVDAGAGPPTGPPTVPGWTVRRRLGTGADAEVWEVRGPAGEQAALKVSLPGGPDGLAQEEAALRHHRHRHLVAPLGRVETDRGPGLLTELLAGGSLAALVRAGGPLPAARMRTAAVPIAQALHSLHAEGIVHGDVSPSNILFDVDGRPALADLGASRLVGGRSRDGCTPGFTAPEVLEEPGTATAASDVFSLAACAWYCLTGRAPAALEDRAPLPMLVPEADAELGDLLDAGLDPDPARRPSAEEFAHALYATGKCEPVLLHASASPEVALVLPTVRPGREATQIPPRRSRRRAAVLAGAGALAAGALAAALLMPGAGEDSGEGTVSRAGERTLGSTVDGAAAGPAEAESEAVDPAESPDPGSEAGETAPTGPEATGRTPASPESRMPAPTGSEAARTTEEPSARAEASEPAAVSPDDAVLARIADERTEALLAANAKRVDAYAVAGSEADAADRAVIERLHAQGSRFEDLTMEVVPDGEPETAADAGQEAEVGRSGGVTAGPGQAPTVAAVPVVLETSAHRLVDAGGKVLVDVPARSDPAVLVMERRGGRWKVSAVRQR